MDKYKNVKYQIMQGIKQYVDIKIEKLSYDKSYVGMISYINTDATCSLVVNNNTYTNVPLGFGSFQIGDTVRVIVPQNNWNDMFVVTQSGSGTYDKTYSATVYDVNSDGTYDITINNIKYKKIKTIGGTCTLNEVVWVLAIQNNLQNLIILKG